MKKLMTLGLVIGIITTNTLIGGDIAKAELKFPEVKGSLIAAKSTNSPIEYKSSKGYHVGSAKMRVTVSGGTYSGFASSGIFNNVKVLHHQAQMYDASGGLSDSKNYSGNVKWVNLGVRTNPHFRLTFTSNGSTEKGGFGKDMWYYS